MVVDKVLFWCKVVSRFHLFCTIISYRRQKRRKKVKGMGNGLNRTIIVWGLDMLLLSRIIRCQGALSVCRPQVLPLLM